MYSRDHHNRQLRTLVFGLCCLFSVSAAPAQTQVPDVTDWPAVENAARGQSLYFYAWGGEPRTNRYLAWVADELQSAYGIRMTHVRISDTAEAVSRVLAEKQAGNNNNGAVDLLWINGENFASMKSNNLLYGPWAEDLPNFRWLNADNNPDVRTDFTVPVDGFESAWLRAHLGFYFDSAYVAAPPDNAANLLSWAQQYPGDFTYPRPPDFLGTTFLKQLLLELVADPAPLYAPADNSQFADVTAPLWTFLDALHPLLLRQGRSFPASGAELRRLMIDGEIALALSFNPTEPVNSVLRGELPDSVRTHIPSGGTLANVSFVAIPFNASHKAAAMIAANFLLSPAAQLRVQDPAHLGSTPAIDISVLPAAVRADFEAPGQSHAAAPDALSRHRTLQEPHPSWMPALERAWLERYGVQ